MKNSFFRRCLDASSPKGWLYSLLSGTVVTALTALYRAFSVYREREGALWYSLCDGAFVAAVLLAGIGLIIWIASTGEFDTLSYAAHTLRRQLFPFGGLSEERPDFYHYKLAREEKRRTVPLLPMLGSGGVFLLLAALFLLLSGGQA